MNPWPIYSYMKREWNHTGKVPTIEEVFRVFKDYPTEEVQEGIIEFRLAYEKAWKHCVPACQIHSDYLEVVN